MQLRKRGLQRIVNKIGSRDYYTALQRSMISLLTSSPPTPSQSPRNRTVSFPTPGSCVYHFTMIKFQQGLHSFYYTSGPYEGRRGQGEHSSLLGVCSVSKGVDSLETGEGEKDSAMAEKLHHKITPQLPTYTDTH